jgi:uroporphyrinogen-III decarboxylase
MAAKLKWNTHDSLAIKKSMGVRRDEFLDHMTFSTNSRPLFTEIFGPLIGLKDEWLDQGASEQELDFSAFPFRTEQRGSVPVSTGWIGGHAEVVLEVSEEYVISRDAMGRRMKLMKGMATLPLPMDHPVQNMDDWIKIKSHYEFSESRFENDWQEVALNHREEGRVVTVSIPGGFDEPRQLMGEEGLCLAYYEQPELIHDMLTTIGDTALQVLDHVSAKVQIDMLSVHEDMAGKSGPLAGPIQVKEFIHPYYRKIWNMLQNRGTRLFDQDSDGDMNPVIDDFLDAGVNVMHPMEVAAGMDVVAVREKYGSRLAFYGGLDKHVIRRSKEEILAELEYKIPPLVRSGGCVLALDHRIPNGTPLENYRFYIEKSWEILNREAGALG